MTQANVKDRINAVGSSMAPLWLLLLISSEVHGRVEALGLEQMERYFACRAAPLGEASAPLVTSTFFNFSPDAVAPAIPGAWAKATPQQVLAAQLVGVDEALTRAFAGLDPAIVAEAAGLLRAAAEAASNQVEGRPLFAGYAALPWPDEPHLVLWHAHYLLREFRGDGHIAVLTAEGLTGAQALALHIATMPAIGGMLRKSRAWSPEAWARALDGLRSRGWLTADDKPLTLTAEGAAQRRAIEDRTDELDLPGFGALGPDRCERVVELSVPLAAALDAAGLTVRF